MTSLFAIVSCLDCLDTDEEDVKVSKEDQEDTLTENNVEEDQVESK